MQLALSQSMEPRLSLRYGYKSAPTAIIPTEMLGKMPILEENNPQQQFYMAYSSSSKLPELPYTPCGPHGKYCIPLLTLHSPSLDQSHDEIDEE